MKNIKTNGGLYRVPVCMIISDENTAVIDAIFDSFFKAVERIYGVGWGRKGWQDVYVDEWNTHVDVPSNPCEYVHPVGEDYR